MQVAVVLVFLAACGPGDIICDGADASLAAACVTAALDTELGCQLLSAPESQLIINTVTGATAGLVFLPHAIDVEEPEGYYCSGLTVPLGARDYSIEIDIVARQRPAAILAHEIGHFLGMRFPANPGDVLHSGFPADIMFYASPAELTTTAVRAMVSEIRAQGLDCSGPHIEVVIGSQP